MRHVPLDVPAWMVHAADDPIVPISQSQDYVAAAREAGAEAELVEVEGGHFGVIEVESPAWPTSWPSSTHRLTRTPRAVPGSIRTTPTALPAGAARACGIASRCACPSPRRRPRCGRGGPRLPDAGRRPAARQALPRRPRRARPRQLRRGAGAARRRRAGDPRGPAHPRHAAGGRRDRPGDLDRRRPRRARLARRGRQRPGAWPAASAPT